MKITTFLAIVTFMVSGTGNAQNARVDLSQRRSAISENPITAGARVGLADVDAISSNPFAYGAFADFRLNHNFLIGAALDYWSAGTGSLLSDSVAISDLALGTSAKLIFTDVAASFRPFVLGGVAVHRFSIDQSSRDRDDSTTFREFRDRYPNNSNRLGFDFGGGVMHRIQSSIDLTGEVRYRRLADRRLDLDQMVYSVAVGYLI